MRIYFTRHGETEWNKLGIIQGQLDSSLTKEGIDMGLRLREKSKDLHFDKVYSSDLGRAYDTAKLICPDREIIKTPLLREIDVGSWSGKNIKDVKASDEILYKKYFEEPENYYRPDGESIYDLKNRVEKFFEENIYNSEDENILIVTHGVTIVAIYSLMENIPIEDFWSNRVRRNGEFNIADYENGKFKIIKKAPKNPVDSIWGDEMNTYDLIIIGAGAAGLSAAIYAGRSLLNTLVIEKFSFGGRVNDTPKIINYPGFKEISGRDLINEFRKQAENFTTNEFTYGTVKKIEKIDNLFKITTLRRKEFTARAIIIATGTYAKMINVPGETEFAGRGVSYCSTCDADYFKDKDIHILGSGDLALEEADYLSNFANSINMIIIHEEGNFDGNKLEAERIMKNPKISYTWHSKLEGIYGNDRVNSLDILDLSDNTNTRVTSDGIFIFAGMSPNSDFVKDLLEIDDYGFIKTDEEMKTSVEGIFAAGDIRKKALRQIVTAANDGAVASVYAEKYIRNRGVKWESIQEELCFIKEIRPTME